MKINLDIEKKTDHYGIAVNGTIEEGGQYLEVSVSEGDTIKKLIEAIKIVINHSPYHNQKVK